MPRVLEALLSFESALGDYAQDLEKLTKAAHPSPVVKDSENKDELQMYLDQRQHEESDAIGELVGPLLTGTYCLAVIMNLIARLTTLIGK